MYQTRLRAGHGWVSRIPRACRWSLGLGHGDCPPPERPLTLEELQDFAVVACTTGYDLILDGLLFDFQPTADGRPIGGLNLPVRDLDQRG